MIVGTSILSTVSELGSSVDGSLGFISSPTGDNPSVPSNESLKAVGG